MHEWDFHLSKNIPENSTLIIGIPDVGLVGPISVAHIVKTLNMELIGYIDSIYLPPILLFHEEKPLFPLRIYLGNKENPIIVILSESAIHSDGLNSLADFLVDFSQKNKIKKILLIGGLAVPNRMQINKPKVYAATICEDEKEQLKNLGIEMLKEGFISGVYALILKKCLKEKITASALLAEAFLNYPDPGAAASVIEAISKIIGKEIDVKQLLEKEEEIRVKLRELMKRTLESMKKTGKEYEFTVPAMYA